MNSIFANNLKKLRLQKQFTQEQVAEVLDVSSQTISRWECNTTYPDVMLLPEIAKLYCVTVDDLFKAESTAYKNYAQRLASIYETTRTPEDFICADNEFRKLIKKGEYTVEDLWTYGTLHHFMMQYCINKAIELFDMVINKGANKDADVFWKTRTQKMLLYSQIGKGKESIQFCLEKIKNNSIDVIDWRCLIQAYVFDDDLKNAYEYFLKAAKKFPNDSIIYTLGGDICKKLGKIQEALSYWDKAIELDSAWLDAKYSKINYYAEIGDKEKYKEFSLEIVEELKREGFDIEADAEEKRLFNAKAIGMAPDSK